MAKKIVAKDLLNFRPYTATDEVDQYYARLASRLYDAMSQSGLLQLLDGNQDDLAHLAIVIALYLEDQVSQLGCWAEVAAEHTRRYGKPVPFYDTTIDYTPQEINFQDVAFLIWQKCADVALAKGAFVSPDHVNIASAANFAMSELEAAYEDAPENERMRHTFTDVTFDPDNFVSYRAAIEWFHYGCYLNFACVQEFFALRQQLVDSMAGAPPQQIDQQIYTVRCQLLASSRLGVLSLTGPEWAERVLSRHTRQDAIHGVRTHEGTYYKYDGHDADTVYLKPYGEKKERLAVSTRSIDIESIVSRPDLASQKDIYLATQLVSYGGKWWVNGSARVLDAKGAKKELASYKAHRAQQEADVRLAAAMQAYAAEHGGVPFHFCPDAAEASRFITDELHHTFAKGKELRVEPADKPLMLTVLPETGIYLQQLGIEALKTDGNPLYDAAKAPGLALMFFVAPHWVAYPVACAMLDHHLLDDAAVNSVMGPDRGRELVQQNAQYLLDHFHHACRERDLKQ